MADDMILSLGLDDSNLIKDLKAVKATLQQWRNNLAKDTNLQAKFGIEKGDVKAVEKTLNKIDEAYAKTSAKLKDPTILAQGSVAAAKEAQKTADVQGKIYNDYLEWQRKADVKATADKEALRAREDKTYNDYLAKQTAGVAKQQAAQDKIYNDYLSSQTAGIAKKREQQDRIYNDYLSKQEAGIKKQAEAEQQAMLARENSLPRLRYALYDVAAGAQRVSNFFTQIGKASIGAAMEYETAFTRVEQTTGGTTNQLAALKNDLLSLAKEIPVAFTDISAIASIGAQMGIATDSLGEFTKTVSQFSSITNVTIENAALSFGALGELLNVSADEFKNLGSAIAYAGVKSNATESEILAVSTAIAGVASTANLTPQYVLGLSTALASLRVPAEQSRGAITRVFQEINRAASTGENLNAFADAMGISEEAAKKLASTDMGQFFNQFVSGLSKMDAQGITKTLDALSLSDIRVTNTLSRLAKNTDIVAQSFQNVDTAYQNGTFLQETAAKRIDDFAAKLQILTNTFKEIAAQVGGIFVTAFGGLIDILISASKWLVDISNNPAGKGIMIVAAAVGGLIAAVASLVGLLAVSVGGLLALRTALGGLVTTTGAAELGIVRFASRLVGLDAVALASAASATKLSTSIAGVGIASNALSKAGPWLLALTVGLTAVAAGWEFVANNTKSASDKAKEYYGGNASIIEAAKQDTAELAAGMQTAADVWNTATIVPLDLTEVEKSTKALNDSKNAASEAVGPIDNIANSQSGLEKSANGATAALDAQTLSFGKNAKAAALKIIQDKIMADADNPLLKIFNDPKLKSAMQQSGISIAEYTNKLLGGDTAGAQAMLDQLWQKYEAIRVAREGATTADQAKKYDEEMQAISDTVGYLEQYRDKTVGLIPQQVALAGAIAGVTDAANKQAAAKTIFDNIDAKAKASKDFVDKLGELSSSLKENGNNWDNMTSGGISNISALNNAINSAISAAQTLGISAAGTIGQVFAQLEARGMATASLLQQVSTMGGQQAIAAQGVQAAQSGAYAGLTSVYNQMKSAASGAGAAADSAAKKVRTLKDYANDLANVFKRAFDIRFSAAADMDKVTKGFRSIADSIASAREEIDGLNADISQLTADKALQEYFLSVANAYGDTLSAGQIQANLVKINSDLAAKNKQLAKAQDKTNKTLVGNSDAAIENRAEILGLVGDYQSYIQSLASSGASQDDLRAATQKAQADFIAQATQLGYNSDELGIYASAFNDVTTAINKVPRDITVEANVDPAIQAMNELNAAANAAAADRTMSLGVNIDYNAMAKFARGAEIVAEINSLTAKQAIYDREYGNGSMDAATYNDWSNIVRIMIRDYTARLNSGSFATGGYTGAGGKYDVAGIVHRGEYVVPKEQVNQATGMPYYMTQPRSFATGGYAGGQATNMMVSLSPEDRAILRNAGGSGDVVLYANNVELARSVNDGNRTIVAQGGRP